MQTFAVVLFYANMVFQVILIFALLYFTVRVLVSTWTMLPFQKGDVPFVPTLRRNFKKTYEFLDLSEGDRMVDIGSGDGRVLLYGARRFEGKFVGVELNHVLILMAKFRALLTPGSKKIEWIRGNYMDIDYSQFNKVFMFNMTSKMPPLVEKLEKELPTGSKVVSFVFPVESDKFEEVCVEKVGRKKLYCYKVE